MAKELKIPPADLTRITQRNGGNFPEAKLIRTISGTDMIISHGTREMPVWGDIFVGEALGSSVSLKDAQKAAEQVNGRIKQLVDFLRSIQVQP